MSPTIIAENDAWLEMVLYWCVQLPFMVWWHSVQLYLSTNCTFTRRRKFIDLFFLYEKKHDKKLRSVIKNRFCFWFCCCYGYLMCNHHTSSFTTGKCQTQVTFFSHNWLKLQYGSSTSWNDTANFDVQNLAFRWPFPKIWSRWSRGRGTSAHLSFRT